MFHNTGSLHTLQQAVDIMGTAVEFGLDGLRQVRLSSYLSDISYVRQLF